LSWDGSSFISSGSRSVRAWPCRTPRRHCRTTWPIRCSGSRRRRGAAVVSCGKQLGQPAEVNDPVKAALVAVSGWQASRYRHCYAVGIFLCPAAGVKSNWKSRFVADISNRLRYIDVRFSAAPFSGYAGAMPALRTDLPTGRKVTRRPPVPTISSIQRCLGAAGEFGINRHLHWSHRHRHRSVSSNMLRSAPRPPHPRSETHPACSLRSHRPEHFRCGEVTTRRAIILTTEAKVLCAALVRVGRCDPTRDPSCAITPENSSFFNNFDKSMGGTLL
jgi:hypothetical protein